MAHAHSCFITRKNKCATIFAGETSDLATKAPLRDDVEAINSGISVALRAAVVFSHILVICKLRAIRDYSLSRVYLVSDPS